MPDEKYIQDIATRIYNALVKEGVPDVNARIIIGQTRHETASYSSNVFKVNNNIAGMKVPSVRKSPYILGAGTAPPSNEGSTPYARYASIEDSARDLVHWLKYQKVNWAQVNTPESYASFLKSKNFYGPSAGFYGGQIRKFFDQMKNWVFKNPGKTVLLIAGSGLLIFGTWYFFVRKN